MDEIFFNVFLCQFEDFFYCILFCNLIHLKCDYKPFSLIFFFVLQRKHKEMATSTENVMELL